MLKFLLVVHVIVAISMVGVILMQRSEGGGLAGGGSPAGLMSARGASDFLTRSTTILATLFVLISIALAAIATVNRAPATIDQSLAKKPGAIQQSDPAAAAALEAANAVTAPPVPLGAQSDVPAVPAVAVPEKTESEKTEAKAEVKPAEAKSVSQPKPPLTPAVVPTRPEPAVEPKADLKIPEGLIPATKP